MDRRAGTRIIGPRGADHHAQLRHLLADGGFAVTDRNHVGVEIVELQQRAKVLPLVEV
jgi:hypothetical protein